MWKMWNNTMFKCGKFHYLVENQVFNNNILWNFVYFRYGNIWQKYDIIHLFISFFTILPQFIFNISTFRRRS